jgi:spore coat protein CotH
MSKHKYTTTAFIVVIIAMLALTVAFIYSPNWGVTVTHAQPEYAEKLFSTDQVHTIDIVVKESDWEDMLVNAQAEKYIQASVVIDGETVSGVGLRPKGNSSLAMIANTDSDRFSFKIEFDHFSDGISYHGLDKLALNNIAQDNTYMKDYITYQMMNEMGADAPLSSFIWVTVNGEDWGLYLAAEGVEESFAQRVYGNDFGEIYKPDSMDMNGGGGFGGERGEGNFPGEGQMPDFGGENGEMPQMPDFSDMQNGELQAGDGQMPNFGDENGEMPQRPSFGSENGEITQRPNFGGGQDGDATQSGQMPGLGGGFGGFGDGATSLIYSDDDTDSYSAIFDNAAFDTSEADKKRLIESLRQLNEGENIEQVVDVDEVIRYFVVHNFVLNSDSYTGNMTHNYYIAENDGQLSMIAWDYNLAFGGMGGLGGGMERMFGEEDTEQTEITTDSATNLVNYPIDTPMLSGSTDDKPMIAWIFNNEEYLAKYHEVFAEYMEYFNSGKFAEMYDNAIALISSYVEKDPTAFCTFEDFQKGSSALREFCLLRAESISKQLDGTIAMTSEGQTATNNTGFVDASGIDIESMGSNSMGFERARGSQFSMRSESNSENSEDDTTAATDKSEEFIPPSGQSELPDDSNFVPPDGQRELPADGNFPQMNAEGNNPEQAFPNLSMGSSETSMTFPLSNADVILLIVCVVVLICGILYAKKRRA